jgi:TRAP-type C4-dicarboxylate transport system substrate-binding protein
MSPEILVFSKVIWDRLSADDQVLIRKAAKDSVPYMRKLWEEREAKARQTVEAGGSEIIPIENKQPFIDATQPVYAKFASTPALQSLVQRIQATQ